MSLGSILRERRESKGLTQDAVAAQVGISKPYLSNLETGRAKNPPADAKLIALETALGFESGQLIRLAHLARTPLDVRKEHEWLEAEVRKLRGVLLDLARGRSRNSAADLEALAGHEMGQQVENGNVRTIRTGSTVPIINRVAAGYPHNFTDLDYPAGVADEYIRCPDLHDSQAFAARVVGDSMEPEYHEDDIVIFSPGTQPRNGDDCFVRFDGDYSTTFKRFYQDDPSTIRLQPLNNRYPAQMHAPEHVTGLWPAVFRFERVRK